jgi:glycosyltransferase involved in cell wall biosynthesis
MMPSSRESGPRAARSPRVNIISWDSGGLATDIDVLTRALERAGCSVAFKGRRYRRARSRPHSLMMTAGVLLAQRWARMTHRPPFDMNIFLESVFPEYLPMARVNCVIVNPEFFRDELLTHVPRLDFMLVKTPGGVDLCRDLSAPCRNIDFTSPDKRIPGFLRQGPLRCLHLSGQSAVKGSEAVVEAWSRHPEWPQLTVVRRSKRYGGDDAPPLPPLPNVRYETDYLTPERLRELQNECEVHVLPSQAEAYGHVIGEAMACGAIVVTTDAPPMNELVRPGRGMLVRVARSEPMSRSAKNFVDVGDLERQLNAVFAMSREARAGMSREARSWFEAQDQRFETSLRALLDELPRLPAKGRSIATPMRKPAAS